MTKGKVERLQLILTILAAYTMDGVHRSEMRLTGGPFLPLGSRGR